MKVELVAIAAIAILTVGCTVDKQLSATGGSRADGIVELSYEIGGLQQARVDWTQAQSDAVARCKAWGYQNAERFGGEKRQCQWAGGYGCNQWLITINYQCSN